ncbi:hypothetical protein DAEQUDRAFT_808290 [Daedalea quercina L-15889]|uniref:Uncharacterized protein n=1 Tax=Daedalea quercina L-15889 TaxID=1314783 RepID=A0A165TM66_9APHY|nr:hypothetical protein DAEQUDRAFT_808290 [Daedalea quercina L-15889]
MQYHLFSLGSDIAPASVQEGHVSTQESLPTLESTHEAGTGVGVLVRELHLPVMSLDQIGRKEGLRFDLVCQILRRVPDLETLYMEHFDWYSFVELLSPGGASIDMREALASTLHFPGLKGLFLRNLCPRSPFEALQFISMFPALVTLELSVTGFRSTDVPLVIPHNGDSCICIRELIVDRWSSSPPALHHLVECLLIPPFDLCLGRLQWKAGSMHGIRGYAEGPMSTKIFRKAAKTLEEFEVNLGNDEWLNQCDISCHRSLAILTLTLRLVGPERWPSVPNFISKIDSANLREVKLKFEDLNGYFHWELINWEEMASVLSVLHEKYPLAILVFEFLFHAGSNNIPIVVDTVQTRLKRVLTAGIRVAVPSYGPPSLSAVRYVEAASESGRLFSSALSFGLGFLARSLRKQVMHIKNHAKRQLAEDPALLSITGFSGVASAAATSVSGALILNTDTDGSAIPSTIQYSFASGGVTLTSTRSAASTSPTTSSSAAPSTTDTSVISHGSAISIGAVVGICVGAFAGLALLIFAFYLYSKRSIKEKKNRSGRWDKLGESEDKWDGSSPTSPGERELQEKNSQMFKKSSPSMRTTRTKVLDDDHGGFNLPPLEFAKYHPGLAKELALEQPTLPYAEHRGESGVSWDGSTVHEDSFLEMRSTRADSGAISPTLGFAKQTPIVESSPLHKWESAEVLTMGDENVAGPKEEQNPFNDVSEQRRSVANPFFNAQEMQRRPTRSRSNSRGTSYRMSRTRSVSESTSVSRAVSFRKSEHVSNPFADIQEVPVYRVAPPDAIHIRTDSVASGNSANIFGAHAMKSLIAALDMPPEEVEERLRVMSTSGSMASSRLSAASGQYDDADIATVRAFPMPPPAVHIEP